jgi:CHAD domain-containing protein
VDPPRTQLQLPHGVSASAAADQLAGHVAVITQRAHRADRTFWDTFDGRLHAAGLALVDSGSRFALTDAATSAERAAEEHPRGLRRLATTDLAAGPLREQLEPLVEMRVVTPIARVRSRLLPISVLDELGKVVVRLQAEEPTVLAGGDAKLALPTRLNVAGVLGYDAEYERVLALLTHELGLVPVARPLQDEAVEAAGGVPGGTSSKLRVALSPDMRADAAAVVILHRLLEIVEANLPGTLADTDSEYLHDLRVAVRRSRALQRELQRVFPPEPLRVFRDGFRELQVLTGPTRDLDVQLLELPALVATPLRELLELRLRAERAKMVDGLQSERTRALLHNWRDFLGALVAAPEADRLDAARPIGDVAGERIATVYRHMVKMGAAIDDDSPHEALHDLRKKGKELRYLLEFFASIHPADVVKPMVATLKSLQDVLGRFQDREVQADALRALGEEIAVLEGGAPALMAMGVLVQRLADEQSQAREQFAERFAQFAAKPQRKLVAKTFG